MASTLFPMMNQDIFLYKINLQFISIYITYKILLNMMINSPFSKKKAKVEVALR